MLVRIQHHQLCYCEGLADRWSRELTNSQLNSWIGAPRSVEEGRGVGHEFSSFSELLHSSVVEILERGSDLGIIFFKINP